MIDREHPLLLGSASPRRREILETLGLPVVVAPAQVDEATRAGESADAYLERVTLAKLEAAGAAYAGPCGAVLVADSTGRISEDIQPMTLLGVSCVAEQNGRREQNGYNVAQYYLDSIVSGLRSPVRLVVKAHGCVTDPAKIVLSRSQYFAAKQKHSLFYRVLDSLFLTSTVLVLGYSLTDPDIQLVLENASIAAQSSHPHYAVLPSGQHPAIAASLQRSYNIHILEYPAGDYAALNQGLEELAGLVVKHRMSFSA